jgi:predicted NAD/FAD-binding protein
MKIAVVGAGISGLSAAYYLSKKHKVDLFEKENHFGGHANTIKVAYDHNKKVN